MVKEEPEAWSGGRTEWRPDSREHSLEPGTEYLWFQFFYFRVSWTQTRAFKFFTSKLNQREYNNKISSNEWNPGHKLKKIYAVFNEMPFWWFFAKNAAATVYILKPMELYIDHTDYPFCFNSYVNNKFLLSVFKQNQFVTIIKAVLLNNNYVLYFFGFLENMLFMLLIANKLSVLGMLWKCKQKNGAICYQQFGKGAEKSFGKIWGIKPTLDKAISAD